MPENHISKIIQAAKAMNSDLQKEMIRFGNERFDKGYALGKEDGQALEKARYHLAEIILGGALAGAIFTTILTISRHYD